MTSVVLDASAVAAWFVPGQATESSEVLLSQVSDTRFQAPFLFPAECRNMFLKAQRRGTMSVADVDVALDFVHALDLQVQNPPDRPGQNWVLSLARREGLSFYDALYLRVALENSTALASRDGPLIQACERCGLAAIDLRK